MEFSAKLRRVSQGTQRAHKERSAGYRHHEYQHFLRGKEGTEGRSEMAATKEVVTIDGVIFHSYNVAFNSAVIKGRHPNQNVLLALPASPMPSEGL